MANDKTAGGAAPTGALRVLVVEDEALLRTLARRLVSRLGHEVDVAASADEAAAAARQWRYDAVICDFQLGGETAADVLVALQAVDAEIASRFIVTSGYDGDPAMATIVEGTGGRVLSKPYGSEEIAAVLAGLARRPD